jgi:hypothetical protein
LVRISFSIIRNYFALLYHSTRQTQLFGLAVWQLPELLTWVPLAASSLAEPLQLFFFMADFKINDSPIWIGLRLL